MTFDHEVEQYLCAAVLRPGNARATRGARGVLCRLLALLRHAFPTARFLVRLDGGFATPETLDVLDAEPRLDYVVAMAENAVLARAAESAMVAARIQSEASGQTAHVYAETRYAAGTWTRERRVVIKAEVVRLAGRASRDNPRFVITTLRRSPRFVYEPIYCPRGVAADRARARRPHGLTQPSQIARDARRALTRAELSSRPPHSPDHAAPWPRVWLWLASEAVRSRPCDRIVRHKNSNRPLHE